MSYYVENVNFLRDRAKELHSTLEEAPKYLVELKDHPQYPMISLGYNGKNCFANSIYNIEDEMIETFRNVDRDTDVLIVFGIGNGRAIEYIKRTFPSLKAVYIVEPSLDVFKKYLTDYNLKEVFFEMGSISFIVNKDEDLASKLILDVFTEGMNSSVEVASLATYGILFEKYYSMLKERVLRGFRTRLLQLVTLNNTKYVWLNNTIKNFQHPHINQEDLSQYLKGKPGVIVGAGPSLNQHFHLLAELKSKAVVVGASSAIKILNSQGIQPDFKMVIDAYPDESIYDETFYHTSTSNPLLYASQTYNEILPKYQGLKVFMLLPTDVFGQYIHLKLKKNTRFVHSGASVVQSAFSFLAQSGCNPIILLGQDMCFYDQRVYADGIESLDQLSFGERGWISMKDIYGKEVHTVRNYLQIKYDYEGLLKQFPETKVINATEGGLGIEGTEIRTLEDVLANELKEPINLNVEKTVEEISDDKLAYYEKMINVFTEVYEEAENIIELNTKKLESLKKLTKNREKGLKISRLRADMEYFISRSEEELAKNEFYNLVIKQNVGATAMALRHLYLVKSDDDLQNITNQEKYLYGFISEIDLFSAVCKDWIGEYIEHMKALKEASLKEEAALNG